MVKMVVLGCKYSLAELESLGPMKLLKALNDVLAEIDPQQGVDISEERPEETAKRMCALLGVLQYNPQLSPSDYSTFRQGLLMGTKSVVLPILHWLLNRIPELKKRAYLGRFLVKLDVPSDFLEDDDVREVYERYEEMVEYFITCHRECEKLRRSEISTAEVKKDISAMEKEKEQLITMVEQLKKRVGHMQNHQKMLEQIRQQRLEKEREESLSHQLQEQEHQLFEAEERLQQTQQQLKIVQRLAAADTNPESLMERLEEEIRINSYMLSEGLSKEVEDMRSTVQYLQEVASLQHISQDDLQLLRDQFQDVDSQIHHLMKNKRMKNDPIHNEPTLHRKQTAIKDQRTLSQRWEEVDPVDQEDQEDMVQWESRADGLENNRSELEQDFTAQRKQTTLEEIHCHHIYSMTTINEELMQRAIDEGKAYVIQKRRKSIKADYIVP